MRREHVLVVAVAAIAAVLALSAPAAAKWRQVSASHETELSAISCTWNCVAIGQDSQGRFFSLHSTNRGWVRRAMVTPAPAIGSNGYAISNFAQLSCTAPNACVAAGSDPCDGPLLERWDGTRWTRQTISDGRCNSPLLGVSCTSARWCVTTGDGLEIWNGKRWSPGGPNNNSDGRMWCPKARACAMIATVGAEADWWDWRKLRSAFVSGSYRVNPDFADVSCRSPRSCVAVGDDGGGYGVAAVWNGNRWRLQYPPHIGGFSSVACGARQCVIFSYDGATNVIVWDGTHFVRRSTGIPSGTKPPQPGETSCIGTRCVSVMSGIWQNF